MKSKTFKFFSMQSIRLAASFEGLNSSLAQLTGELQSCKVMVIKWLTWVLKVKQNKTSSEDVKLAVYVTQCICLFFIVKKIFCTLNIDICNTSQIIVEKSVTHCHVITDVLLSVYM